MGDVQGLAVQGVHHPGRKFSRCNYLQAVFLSGNCLVGNCLGDNYPRLELSGGGIVRRAMFLGGNCPRGSCPGAIVQGEIIWGTIAWGAIVLGGNCPGWQLSYNNSQNILRLTLVFM